MGVEYFEKKFGKRGTLAINSAAPLASGELFALVNGFRKKPILRPRSNS